MNFQQFKKQMKERICGTQIKSESECRGYSIIESTDGKIYVDFKETELTSLEEARRYIDQIVLEEELTKELYEDIPSNKIAKLIKEHHDVKVTDTLIESYVSLASSKLFSVDPVITGIRSMNSLDSLVENKIDYVLEDGSVVAIDEATQEMLNNLLEDKAEIVQYMRECKEQFMRIVKELS